MCDAAGEKPAKDAGWESQLCLKMAKQRCNQEKSGFPIFPVFVVLTLLSANVSQIYVWLSDDTKISASE